MNICMSKEREGKDGNRGIIWQDNQKEKGERRDRRNGWPISWMLVWSEVVERLRARVGECWIRWWRKQEIPDPRCDGWTPRRREDIDGSANWWIIDDGKLQNISCRAKENVTCRDESNGRVRLSRVVNEIMMERRLLTENMSWRWDGRTTMLLGKMKKGWGKSSKAMRWWKI